MDSGAPSSLPPPSPVATSGLARARATLAVPHFAPFFASNFAHFLFAQVAMMALSWLMTELTESRLLITLVWFMQGVTIFTLSPLAGVVADRVAKKWLLVGCRLAMVGVVVTMGTLVATDVARIGHLWVASVVAGTAMALMQPAAQTFVFDLVGRDRIENAISLGATANGVGQVLGPAAGGAVLVLVGTANAFYLAGAGMLLAAGLILAVPVSGRAAATGERKHPFAEVREGFAWAWSERGVRIALLASTMAFFNGAIVAMRPVFARFVLETGEAGLSGMASAAGTGTVVTAVALSLLPRFRYLGLWIVGGLLGYAIAVFAYAFAFSYPYVLGCELLLGVSGQVWNVTVMAGLQLAAPPHLRGRVLSMAFMVAQLGFLGQPIVGALADRLGDRVALGIFGAIPTIVLTTLLVTQWRVLAQLGEPAPGALEPLVPPPGGGAAGSGSA